MSATEDDINTRHNSLNMSKNIKGKSISHPLQEFVPFCCNYSITIKVPKNTFTHSSFLDPAAVIFTSENPSTWYEFDPNFQHARTCVCTYNHTYM